MEYKFTKDNFEAEVVKSDKPVLVDFYADWCGPCRSMMPAVEALAEKYEGRAKVGKVSVDKQEELAAQFGIRSIPFFAFVKDGKVVDSVLGAVPSSELEKKLDALV